MPGVYRPYTLVDVLGTLSQQSQQQADLVNGFGDFAETDEQVHIADAMTLTHGTSPMWDAGTWGTFTWN